MPADFIFKQGDNGPAFVQQLSLSDGSIPSLVGATVGLELMCLTDGSMLSIAGLVEVANGPGGQVAYTPTSTDTAVAGDYMGSWIVQFPDGTQQTFPTDGYVWLEIQPNLSAVPGTALAQMVVATAEVIRPSVEDLASITRARTTRIGSGGQELGTYTENTRPTYEEAQRLIGTAVTHVLSAVGFDMPNWAYNEARQLVLFYAARLLEVTFYPLTVGKGESPYEAYGELYNETLTNLTNAIENDVGGAPHQAVFSVPVMTAAQGHFKALQVATAAGDYSKLPDDMSWPMGPKGLPFVIPGNSSEWDLFDWSFDTWMEA